MAHDRALAAGTAFAGWRIWSSDAGRYWATRMHAFSRAAEHAGAARTVDGDSLPALCRSIAEQESTADLAAPCPPAGPRHPWAVAP
jgi:hypothetical protein